MFGRVAIPGHTPMVHLMNSTNPTGKCLVFAGVSLDLERRCLIRDGDKVPLRPKAMDLLIFLANRPGRLATKDEILDAVWQQTVVTKDSITQCVIEIRRALGDPNRSIVRTVPKQGFILDVPVREIDAFACHSSKPDIGEQDKGDWARYVHSPRATIVLVCLLLLTIISVTWSHKPATSTTLTVADAGTVHRVAVLPFKNLNPPGVTPFFAEGLSQEIIHQLSREPELRVIGASSSFTFRDWRTELPSISRALDVSHVIAGALRVEGDMIRITAQLVDVRSSEIIWSKAFDRHLHNAVGIQSEIALAVAEELSQASRYVAADAKQLSWRADSYTAFLKGQFYFARRLEGDVERSRLAFVHSIASDPHQARAWAGLAGSLWILAAQEQPSLSSGFSLFRHAAERALELDPTLAEAHVRIANFWYLFGDLSKAHEHLVVAEEIDPNNVLLLSVLAGNSLYDGQMEKALTLQKRALDLNPLAPVLRLNLAGYYLVAGRLDKARAEYMELLELAPTWRDSINESLAIIAVLQGNHLEALSLLPEDGETAVSALRAIALWADGQREQSNRVLDKLINSSANDPLSMVELAEVYAQRGNIDEAATRLMNSAELISGGEHSFVTMCSAVMQVNHSPFLAPVKSDDRWARVVERLLMLRDAASESRRATAARILPR